MSDDIMARLRREMWYQPEFKINQFGKPNQTFELTRTNLIAADEIERLRAERDELRRENAALRAEIERYRIQSVQLMDLQRLLEVQDRQLESAQRALQILGGANGGDAKAQGCCGGTRSLSGPIGSRDVG